MTTTGVSDQTARLRREFEFAQQLDHPHVVTVYDYGVGWLTMELVDGGTASALTSDDGPSDRAGADRRCAGLHPSVRDRALRRQAIQHPCLAGFLPRGVDRLRCRVTRSPKPSGGTPTHIEASLPYTAPELLRGRPPSALTEQYALACTAVELLLGAPPYSADNLDGTRGRSSQPASAELLAQDRMGATPFRLGTAAGRWRRSRRADTTRARSSSRSSPVRWASPA